MSVVIISSILRVALACVMAYGLYRFDHILNIVERIGMGVLGGMCLMTIFVVMDVKKQGTPFDDWAGLGYVAGMLIFFSGFFYRKMRHDRNNKLQIKMWEEHKRQQGK